MVLSEKDIEIGFWRFGLADDRRLHPQPTVQIPGDIRDRERLSLNLHGEEGWTESQRKKFRKEWLQLLTQLTNLKYLWLNKVNPEIFEAVSKITGLEGLWMKSTSLADLDAISGLQQLAHLYIGGSPKLQDLTPLANLPNLTTLHTEGLKKISDFNIISTLKNLQGLIIEGDMWTPQTIDTLKPFSSLKKLSYLAFTNVKVSDKDCTPLTALKQLQRLDIHYRWTKADAEKLYGALPALKYGDVKRFVEEGKPL